MYLVKSSQVKRINELYIVDQIRKAHLHDVMQHTVLRGEKRNTPRMSTETSYEDTAEIEKNGMNKESE